MNTHNVKVKTATTETTETWVKQNFDVLLLLRADRLLTLAQLEGNLMMYRALAALDAFGPDHLDRLLSDVRYAAERITTMLDEGDIATPVAYELATSVLSLIFETVPPEEWDGVDVPDLPDLAWLQENAPLQREALRQSFIEAARPFGLTVSGRMELPDDDFYPGTYWCDAEVSLGRADSLPEAMELLVKASLSGDWKQDEQGGYGFEPHIATITDIARRVVLCGNARTLEWAVPETDPAAFERIAAQKQALREQAAYESGWDNFETARQLRQEADMLDVSSVHTVWQNHPHVAEALREYQHPSTRLDETEIMEGMEF
ncbi:hypothetical protein [Pantoea sp. V108_6]|uniref:hypothetical protein n=1 Tax=Pantoea sp. V108_6 TaxID=3044235 RepID=UPI00249F7E05|nr:hypothetical protein [Pantoea sp. V108_6]MDI3366254.1 hypothetical protein [Pantoea sp. V108_6]